MTDEFLKMSPAEQQKAWEDICDEVLAKSRRISKKLEIALEAVKKSLNQRGLE